MNKKENSVRINSEITGVQNVRLIGDNVETGIYSFDVAYKMADDMDLDLVEINRSANPAVCKIIDYQKYLYQQKKAQKEREDNSKTQELKEIRLTPNIGDNDYGFKLNHAIEFLKENNKVKITVFFKGRELIYKEQGELLITKFCNDLLDYGTPEKMPTLEGRNLYTVIKPKKK